MTVILMYRHLWKLTAKQRLLSHSITKTLQNGSRQLRTDRNLPRNSTDRPKDKVCVTGSDSFRKRVNRVLSRSRERNPKAGTDNHDIGNQHRRATCLAVLHIYQSIRKHPARFFSSCRVFSYAIQTQQKPESFLRIAFLFWVEFVNETNSSISKQVRPLNSTRMSFAFNINSITFSSCL